MELEYFAGKNSGGGIVPSNERIPAWINDLFANSLDAADASSALGSALQLEAGNRLGQRHGLLLQA
jgi:hypothetical protein